MYFHDEAEPKAKTKQIIISVKSGEKVTVSQLRDLRGVIDGEDAEIGVLISMAKPTSTMRKETASAGFYKSPWGETSEFSNYEVEIANSVAVSVFVTLRRGKPATGPSSLHCAVINPSSLHCAVIN